MAMQFWPLWLLQDRGLWRTDLAAQRRGARTLQEASMFGPRKEAQKTAPTKAPTAPPATLLTVVGDTAKMEGKFQIADSIQIECEVGGELRVGGKLVIGEKGVVNANVETVDAVILGYYDGSMTATGNVEITATGRVSGNIKTDSLVIAKGGSFRGNVAKINEEPAATHRPLYRIEDKLAGQITRDNSQMSEHARPPEVG
jgi:cytoskeletal protein CcmA (bactofilin family)